MARSRSNSSSSSSSDANSLCKHEKKLLKKQEKIKKKHDKCHSDKHPEGIATGTHPSLPVPGLPSFVGTPLAPSGASAPGSQAHAPSFPSVPPTTTAPVNTLPQPSHEQSRGLDQQQHVCSPQQQHVCSPQQQHICSPEQQHVCSSQQQHVCMPQQQQPGAQAHSPSFPSVPTTMSTAPVNNMFPKPSHEQSRGNNQQQPQQQQSGAYTQRASPSGFRFPLSTDSPFPHEAQIGSAPFRDADGVSPVYVGSALFASSVHPCKVAPALLPTPCRVPYGGGEFEHKGRYDVLPITTEMEWVRASRGDIPAGRQPVEGGYEENGDKLYHAVVTVDGVKVPGKCGKHLGGAHVAFGWKDIFSSDYEVLCWKY